MFVLILNIIIIIFVPILTLILNQFKQIPQNKFDFDISDEKIKTTINFLFRSTDDIWDMLRDKTKIILIGLYILFGFASLYSFVYENKDNKAFSTQSVIKSPYYQKSNQSIEEAAKAKMIIEKDKEIIREANIILFILLSSLLFANLLFQIIIFWAASSWHTNLMKNPPT